MGEYNNPTHDSKLAQHQKINLNHSTIWFIVAGSSNNKRTRQNLEAIYIVLKRVKLTFIESSIPLWGFTNDNKLRKASLAFNLFGLQ